MDDGLRSFLDEADVGLGHTEGNPRPAAKVQRSFTDIEQSSQRVDLRLGQPVDPSMHRAGSEGLPAHVLADRSPDVSERPLTDDLPNDVLHAAPRSLLANVPRCSLSDNTAMGGQPNRIVSMSEPSQQVGLVLRALREQQGRSLREVASRLGVQPSTLHSWETGGPRGKLFVDNLVGMAAELGAGITILVEPGAVGLTVRCEDRQEDPLVTEIRAAVSKMDDVGRTIVRRALVWPPSRMDRRT
jgi:transcriptional regulator with XRE-family HTH domain